MPSFKHILFPVDFSEACQVIRPVVLDMAERFGSRLSIMHVIETPIGWYGGMEAAYPVLFDVTAMTQDVCKKLDSFVHAPQTTRKANKVVEHGEPAGKIVTYAEENGVDLIMMPTYGYGKFRELLLGSIAAKVLHDSKCAVWTAAHVESSKLPAHGRYRSILCAVDLEPGAVPLIRAAADLAGQLNARLRLVHAVSATESLPDQYLNSSFRDFLLDTNREAIKGLQREAGVDFEVCMEGGRISSVVSAAARHHNADLVVIGRGRLYERFGRLRSNAYTIIRDSPCPVLSL